MKHSANWEIIYLLTKRNLKPKEIMKLGYPVTAYAYEKKLDEARNNAERRFIEALTNKKEVKHD
jgi:hypothetical protein